MLPTNARVPVRPPCCSSIICDALKDVDAQLLKGIVEVGETLVGGKMEDEGRA